MAATSHSLSLVVALCALGACLDINPLFKAEDDGSSGTGSAEDGAACDEPGAPALDDRTCDGIDDDCDGIVDDDYIGIDDCGVGHCQATNTPSSCSRGVETPCEPGDPISEIPGDGIDQGCNGGDGPDGPPFNSFFDDFEDGVIDPGWLDPSCSAGCSVEEAGGAMAFGMSGSQSCSCILQTSDVYSLVDHGVVLDVPAITMFHPPLGFFMAVTNAGGDTIEYGFDGDDVFYAQIVEGDSTTFSSTSTYEPRPRYWQIREQGGLIYFESSMDGAAWDIEMQTDTPFYVGGVRFSFGAKVESFMPSSIGISTPNYNTIP